MYILDCTHGYDRQSLHLASRYPRQLPSNDVLSTFSKNVWLAIIASIFMLVATIMLAIYMYTVSDSSLVRSNIELSLIVIRLVAGFTEPDQCSWFKTFSAGQCCHSLKKRN